MQRSANAVMTLIQLAKEIVGSCKNSGTSQFQTLYTNPAPINVLAQTLIVTKRLSFVIFFNFFIITNSSSYILFDNNMEKEGRRKRDTWRYLSSNRHLLPLSICIFWVIFSDIARILRNPPLVSIQAAWKNISSENFVWKHTHNRIGIYQRRHLFFQVLLY